MTLLNELFAEEQAGNNADKHVISRPRLHQENNVAFDHKSWTPHIVFFLTHMTCRQDLWISSSQSKTICCWSLLEEFQHNVLHESSGAMNQSCLKHHHNSHRTHGQFKNMFPDMLWPIAWLKPRTKKVNVIMPCITSFFTSTSPKRVWRRIAAISSKSTEVNARTAEMYNELGNLVTSQSSWSSTKMIQCRARKTYAMQKESLCAFVSRPARIISKKDKTRWNIPQRKWWFAQADCSPRSLYRKTSFLEGTK